MARTTTTFTCSSCGATSVRWTGRCAKCGEFSTMVEQQSSAPTAGLRTPTAGTSPSRPARPASSVQHAGASHTPTGIGEFDRVLGGGLVAGQVVLLSGEPGAGKSTLLLAVAHSLAQRTGRTCLYVSGEESVGQLAVRARRIGATSEKVLLADDTDLAQVLGHIDAHGDDLALVIVDSVQTVASATVDGRAGGVTQVMEVAQTLTRVAKTRGVPVFLVGQVTKESTVAGPRALEHIADASISLDGDRHTSLRLLRAVKNRYGPADEVACFEQTDEGLREVPDPSSLFRGNRETPVAGTCTTVTVEGRRPMLAEVQALVSPTTNPNPRRGVSGLDSARVAMLVAVTERHARLRLFDKDLFVATVGGIRLTDPASDLAVCLAIASADGDQPLSADLAAVGEVSLSGDLRPVGQVTQRIAEALRLGHSRILVPSGTRERLTRSADASALVEVPTLGRALAAARGRRND